MANYNKLKPNTERNYLLGFQWFTEYTEKEPETRLLESEQEIKDGLLMRQRSIKKYLRGFRKMVSSVNSKSVDETQREYSLNSNPVQAFLDEHAEESEGNFAKDVMYAAFKSRCKMFDGHHIKIQLYVMP
jgi:hypothetical protein